MQTLKDDMQQLEHVLSASGGKLEVSKCFYDIVAWEFTPQGDPIPMPHKTINDNTSGIGITERGQMSSSEIKIKKCDDAHWTWGVWKTVMGDQTKQLELSGKKATTLHLL
jgi:hypothetical protein